jgi:REP element-mobilizing transposase RayT
MHNVNYNIVWSVKYRCSVLSAEIEAYLRVPFQEIAQEKEFEVAKKIISIFFHRHTPK